MVPITIQKEGEWTDPLSIKVKEAFEKAESGQTKLSETILRMEGMSGRKYRSFINNLVETVDDARYLEIGSWKGSTACSAMFGNKVKAVCIDNWSEFLMGSHAKEDFHKNVNSILTENIDFTFHEQDSETIDFSNIGKYNVYFYDGWHSKEAQYNALVKALPAVDDTFVFIVDDYNREHVREGTEDAIRDTGVEVLSKITVLGNLGVDCQNSDWHEGYFIAVLRKT